MTADDTDEQPVKQPSERRVALEKQVQDWLDKFAEEKLNVNYGASLSAIVVQAQMVYLRLLIDTDVIDEDASVCKQLEIQALLLEDAFKAALLARDEDDLRRAQQARSVQPVRGPRLIIPGGRQRDLRDAQN